MDFTLPEEIRMLRDTVARFVREELIPLEPTVIRRDGDGKTCRRRPASRSARRASGAARPCIAKEFTCLYTATGAAGRTRRRQCLPGSRVSHRPARLSMAYPAAGLTDFYAP